MRVEGAYNWSDGIPADGRIRLKSLFDSGKTIAIAYGMSWDYVGLGEIFPTPEAALTSIKIYDLEGNEVKL